MNDSDRERQALRDGTTLRQLVKQKTTPADVRLEPGNAFEAVTRQMVDDLRGEIQAVRTRLDSLFSVVIGAIVLDVLLRLAGVR
ncbi:MAG TPA: hypothetical protein VHV31_01365 [Nitrolancea sp.]|jgi:hypothetical protein|nr:hypothetical protein [Nitrolancea sp.]